jgi:hypothetical protein
VAPGKTQQLQIRVSPSEKTALKRLARRAGVDVSAYVLSRLQLPVRSRLEEALAHLRRGHDRFALAALNALLAGLTPVAFSEALADLRVDGCSELLQNYVAAMVEQAADQKGVVPPAWVQGVEPLERPYFAVPFAGLRPHLLREAPVTFKRRNIFVDASVGAGV